MKRCIVVVMVVLVTSLAITVPLSAQGDSEDGCGPETLAQVAQTAIDRYDPDSVSESSEQALARLQTLRDTIGELISSCESTGDQPGDGSSGTGTFADPFKFGVAGDTGQGLSIKVIGVVRPADTLIRSFNRFNDRPGPGQEYIRLTIEVSCNEGGSEACDTNYFDFNLTGSKGVVYDFASVVNDDDLDVTVFPGASGTGTVVFLIDAADTDLA